MKYVSPSKMLGIYGVVNVVVDGSDDDAAGDCWRLGCGGELGSSCRSCF